METIDNYRNRLDTLRIDNGQTLASCRALQNGLRKLKREVLTEILKLRTQTRRQAQQEKNLDPSLRNLWRKRKDFVDDLVDNVKERLTGDEDDEHLETLEAWAEINREIDSRLEHLDELEEKLAEAAGEGVVRRTASGRPIFTPLDDPDDDLYAAVGAEAQARRSAATCPECGSRLGAGDRFCSKCGHRLE